MVRKTTPEINDALACKLRDGLTRMGCWGTRDIVKHPGFSWIMPVVLRAVDEQVAIIVQVRNPIRYVLPGRRVGGRGVDRPIGQWYSMIKPVLDHLEKAEREFLLLRYEDLSERETQTRLAEFVGCKMDDASANKLSGLVHYTGTRTLDGQALEESMYNRGFQDGQAYLNHQTSLQGILDLSRQLGY
jgi:hypothetical protein